MFIHITECILILVYLGEYLVHVHCCSRLFESSAVTLKITVNRKQLATD